jgi:Xaa-Pro aminopeptidase
MKDAERKMYAAVLRGPSFLKTPAERARWRKAHPLAQKILDRIADELDPPARRGRGKPPLTEYEVATRRLQAWYWRARVAEQIAEREQQGVPYSRLQIEEKVAREMGLSTSTLRKYAARVGRVVYLD